MADDDREQRLRQADLAQIEKQRERDDDERNAGRRSDEGEIDILAAIVPAIEEIGRGTAERCGDAGGYDGDEQAVSEGRDDRRVVERAEQSRVKPCHGR